MRPSRALCAVALAIAGLSAYADELSASGTPNGAAIFQRRCSVCHGEQGNGQSRATRSLAMPPRDFTAEESRIRLTRQYMIAVVRDGRPSTPMVGRRTVLSQDEIEAVVNFIRAAFLVPDPGSTRAQGYSLYRQKCAGCHGERGRGVAAGGNHPEIRLPLRTGSAPLNPDDIVKGIQREPHARGVRRFELTPSDAQAIAEYTSSAFIERSADSSRSAAAGDTGR